MKVSLVRYAVAVGLLLAFAVSFSPVSAQGVPSLTVHARYCDPGTVPDDPFTARHDNPLPDFNVGFDGVSNAAITDDDGNVSFTALAPRSYQLFVSAPLKATSSVVYCRVVGGDGSALPLGTASSGVTVPVASGQEVVCDWYWLISDGPSAGEDAPFTIHVGLCPNDQVPSDFFATCHGNPGANIEF
ncbi:MAG TPA: hypothetical protein PK819_09200, partial [Thermomicrobiales bacterium]|nr:hypothetical protein [Thermomicrobiales bacterium]